MPNFICLPPYDNLNFCLLSVSFVYFPVSVPETGNDR